MEKPKIALYWCSSCGGCDASVIDIAEGILEIASNIDIVFWPIAMDFKYDDIEKMRDGEIYLSLINGSIQMDEHARIARLLRQKSRFIAAHGSCAHLGGIFGLANLYDTADILKHIYIKGISVKNQDSIQPNLIAGEDEQQLILPAFLDSVKPLNNMIGVDYYIPGCPPTPELVKSGILRIISEDIPPHGTVLTEKKALCDTCARKDSQPDKIHIDEFKRLFEFQWDESLCFLAQGLICLGPATRGGCLSRCINANMPCRGCFGPTDNTADYGAKTLSFLASLVQSRDKDEMEKIADSIPDIAGLLYRYCLPSSLLKDIIK